MLKIQIMDMLLPWLLKTGGKLLITVLIAVIGYKVIRAKRASEDPWRRLVWRSH